MMMMMNHYEDAGGFSSSSDEMRISFQLRDNKNIQKSSTSKCMDISSQSSQVGFIAKYTDNREIHGIDNTCNTKKLDVEQLEVSRLVATHFDCRDNGKDFKIAMSSIDPDLLGTAVNENICRTKTSNDGITSSSPCESTSIDVKRCACCKQLQRVDNISEAHELCSCNTQEEHNLLPYIDEESSELLSIPNKSEVPAACSQGNDDEGYLVPEATEQSHISKKQNCLATSPYKENLSVPVHMCKLIMTVMHVTSASILDSS